MAFFRQIFDEVGANYPDISKAYNYVDAAALDLIRSPWSADVMVMENMFGDILTDEASVISGSMGLMPSASIGLHTSVFEPIHGSYPQAAGKKSRQVRLSGPLCKTALGWSGYESDQF